MRIFLTGGTGFVGSHFLNQALAAGHEVVALRRTRSSTRVDLLKQPVWVTASLDDVAPAHLEGIDALVHLAAHTPNPPYAPLAECLYWNAFAPLRLAAQAHAAGVRRFLVAGSCFEYGDAAKALEYVDTDTPLAPNLSYPTSKAAASTAFEGFTRENSVRLKLLRIFQVYGEGEQASRFWPSLRRAALAGDDFPMSAGRQVRDFIEVGEVARQFLQHLDFSGSVDGVPDVRHVATGRAQSLLAFAEDWWKFWGGSGQLRPGAVPYRKNELFRLVPRPHRQIAD